MISRSCKRNGWRKSDWFVAATVCVCAFAVAWPVWRDILHIAFYGRQETHIFIAPLTAIWLVWVRRGRIQTCIPMGRWVGPVILLIGIALIQIGPPINFESFVHSGALLMAIGCVIAVLGVDVLRQFLPAFVVLLLVVPAPGIIREGLIEPIQAITVNTSLVLLESMGVSVDRAGALLSINGYALPLAELNKGAVMLLTVLLATSAFAFGLPLRPSVRFFILATTPLAVVALNVVRMIPTVWLYGRADPALAGTVHAVSGWLALAVLLILVWLVVRLLRWAAVPVTDFVLAYD